ncbi:MAG: aminotransferase class V-fold PLP-dependent enzyme [Firmicutes bacterium]|nr:aminotransferase class V-fold PLP-dependent enzyme [Bacillota bacterium]
MTLKNHIDEYLKRDIYPFHMPGHKRGPVFSPWAAGFLRRDLTEIPGMDNLRAPSGVLREFQERIALIYGAGEAAFLVNGATAGVFAAVMASCGDGERLVVARNSHGSVFGAMAAAGVLPRYVYPETTQDGLVGWIAPDEISRALDENPDCRAVLVTSPTYEGVVSDVAGIARAAHARGAVLIVDEAHGAHFPFHEAFPSPAVRLGADAAVVSFHKTLPCPSQCAALLWNGAENGELIRRYLALTQTSSPSYAFMAITDEVLTELRNRAEHFEKYVRMLRGARERLAGLENLRLFTGEASGGSAGADQAAGLFDISKITILTGGLMTGAELERELIAAKIQPELAGRGHVLALTGVADTEAGFGRLADALYATDRRLATAVRAGGTARARTTGQKAGENPQINDERFTDAAAETPPAAPPYAGLPRVAVRYSPRLALRMKTRKVSLADSFGEAAGEFIAPYPPGIPVLAPGEVIDPAALGDYLRGRETISIICD